MLGGVCGLVGTSMLGPRSGIFDKKTVGKLVRAANLKKKSMKKHNNEMGVDEILNEALPSKHN